MRSSFNYVDDYLYQLVERQKVNMKHIFNAVLTPAQIRTELAKGKTKQGLQHAIDNNLPVLIIKNSGSLPYPNCKEPERCKDLNACPREYSCSH